MNVRTTSCSRALLTLLALLLPACAEDSPKDTGSASARSLADAGLWTFTDITARAGLDFRYTFGDDQFSFILEDTGSGCALLDADGDGWLDLYLLNGTYLEGISDPAGVGNAGARNALYRNRRNGTFEDLTPQSGTGDTGYGMGAAVGDYDGDGDVDLYVLNYGPNVLYRNDGGGRFTEVTELSGLAGPDTVHGFVKWSVNGAFLDFDQDGDLDLYVANYLAFDPAFTDPDLPPEYPYPGPESYAGQASLLYRNDGTGRFEDVTAALGLLQEDGKTMGVAPADLDGDGDLDLFEAMDSMANLLFRNDGDHFTEVGAAAGISGDRSGKPMASMHASIADLDGDGRLDIFVPDLASGCLYANQGDLRFEEVGALAGLAQILQGSGGWGSHFADFDNDGYLDLLLVLGGAFDLNAGEADRLFLGDGQAHFTDVSKDLGPYFQQQNVSRGAAFGDLDNDGDIDFLVSRKDLAGTPHLIQNDLPPGRHWIQLRLQGAAANTQALGARVELVAAGRTQLREVGRSGSYLSQNDVRVHFGLGNHDQIEELRIRWPDGSISRHTDLVVDRIQTVEQPVEGE